MRFQRNNGGDRPEDVVASATPPRRRSRLSSLFSRRRSPSHQSEPRAQKPPDAIVVDLAFAGKIAKSAHLETIATAEKKDDLPRVPNSASISGSHGMLPSSLWDVAYDALRDEDDESKRRVEKYEKILSSRLQAEQDGRSDGKVPDEHARSDGIDEEVQNTIDSDQSSRRKQMDKITALGLKKSDSQQIKFHIGKTEVNVGDQVKKGLAFIQWAQGWVGQAAAASPEASVAWAVVSLALPLLTNPISTAEAHDNGYEKVTSLMQYYVAQEAELLGINKDASGNATFDKPPDKGARPEMAVQIPELRKRIIQLYKAILDFQIQSVLRFYRNRLKVFTTDALCLTDWEALAHAVETREADVKDLSQHILSAKTSHSLEMLREGAIEVRQEWHRHLSALEVLAKENLATSKEILMVSAQNGETARQQLASSERVETTIKEIHDMAVKKVADKSVQRIELMRLLAEQVSYEAGPEKTKDRITSLVEGTGRWLLESESYHACLKHKSGLHLAAGLPGCGKSVISGHLIDSALPNAGFTTVCYFFFDQHSTSQALCSILHQVFSRHEVLVHHAFHEYDTRGKTIVHNPTILWNILEAVASDPASGRMAVVFDALDQCKDDQIGDFILDHHNRRGNLHLFMTTRPYDYIITRFEASGNNGVFVTHGEGEDAIALISAEVEKVVEFRISKLRWPERMKQRLKERMLQVRNPTYLWIRLIFDSLQPRRGRSTRGFLPTNQNIDKLLSELPQDFNEVYDQILCTTANQDLMRTAMSLIIASQRPLTIREMNVAMQLSPSAASFKDLVDDLLDDTQFEDALRQWCGLFIIIQESNIYLLHETGREFFTRPPSVQLPKPLAWQGSISLQQAHTTTAQVCIWALSLRDLLDDAGKPVLLKPEGLPIEELIDQTTYTLKPSHDDRYPFIAYACLNWAKHVRESEVPSSELGPLYNRLCEPSNALCQSWFGLYAFSRHLPVVLLNLDPVTLRVILGQKIQVLKAIEDDPKVLRPVSKDPDRQGLYQPLPLLLAALMAEDEDLVEALLEAGADPNDTFGPEAPLPWLIHEGPARMIGLVPLLLQYRASTAPVIFEDWIGRTPVYAAARKGLHGVLKLLLEHEKSIGAASTVSFANYEETPLHVASDMATMEVLLQYGADPLALNQAGRTPLETCEGHHLRRLLLEACHTQIGETHVREALDTATSPEEVAMLFEYGAKPHLKNRSGDRPLFSNNFMYATAPIHQPKQKSIIQEYLKHCDVDHPDNLGRTPLLHFASIGSAVAVKELLAHGASFDVQDHEGRTALHLVCSWSAQTHEKSSQQRGLIMRYLLESSGSRELLHATDSQGQTALHLACRWADENMVRYLLDKGLHVEAVDKKGRTPLMHAVISHNAVYHVPILHQYGASLEARDNDGFTAFHLIFTEKDSSHSDGIVRILAARMDVDVTDNEGRTPLMYAIRRSTKRSTFRALLEQHPSCNKADTQGWQPLHHVNSQMPSRDLSLLIEHGGNVSARTPEGELPIHTIFRSENPRAGYSHAPLMIQILLEHKADVNAQQDDGKTALHIACSMNYYQTARVLLEAGADVSLCDVDGETPIDLITKQRLKARLSELLARREGTGSSYTLPKDALMERWETADEVDLSG